MTESTRSRRLKTRVRVRLPTDLYDALVVIARVRGVSLDATVRRAASEYVASARQAATPETPQVWDAMLAAAPQQHAGVDGMVMVQASDLKTVAEFADRGMRGNPAKLAALRAKAILAANRKEGE